MTEPRPGCSSTPTPTPQSPARRGWFHLPPQLSWKRLRWPTLLSLLLVHVLALLAFVPHYFSWSGIALLLVGVYVFGTLGINIGFHRLLTHRSFKTPRWFERTLAVIGICNLEGSPINWVANHRKHHQHADDEPDPHSPVIAFLWSHVGWLLVRNPSSNNAEVCGRYARDLCKDRFYFWLERRLKWTWIYLAHAALFFVAGFFVGGWIGGDIASGLRLGVSWLIWGVLVRTVVVWHITWSVNSITHLFGYRNYETGENSRNNWIVGLLALGEGWHNNHHADQRSAAHGHRWWEFDATYLTILLFSRIGLATRIIPPSHRLKDRKTAEPHHHSHAL
ncbi:MAG TPA: fatty acid desaturase [Phycisphaerales bacterium]|nr:fatty acid desaturase [Phycisphaerales bacterium]